MLNFIVFSACTKENCSKEFSSRGGLRRHERCHNNDYFVQCEVCDKGFFPKADYTDHRKIHWEDGLEHSCKDCGKTYKHRTSLQRHMKEHREEKTICQFCGKMYFKGSFINMRSNILELHQDSIVNCAGETMEIRLPWRDTSSICNNYCLSLINFVMKFCLSPIFPTAYSQNPHERASQTHC